jgi:PTS system mannose-specific IIA component
MIRGIVVTHGNLSHELLQTAQMIFGEFADCVAVSSASKSPQALLDELTRIAPSSAADQAILFVDFYGGGCGYACVKYQQSHPDVPIISGVNLPMILTFLNKRGEVPFDKLVRDVVVKGRDSITIVEL